MRDQLKDRCNKIEECYEFMLAYAAQGLRTEPGSGTASQVRTLLTRADEALNGLGDVFTQIVRADKLVLLINCHHPLRPRQKRKAIRLGTEVCD